MPFYKIEGSFSNSPCIVSKSIGRNRQHVVVGSQTFASGHDSSYCDSITTWLRVLATIINIGSLTFHAPKAAGPFVFRLFDQASKESSSLTLATSFMFNVVLMDYDVTK